MTKPSSWITRHLGVVISSARRAVDGLQGHQLDVSSSPRTLLCAALLPGFLPRPTTCAVPAVGEAPSLLHHHSHLHPRQSPWRRALMSTLQWVTCFSVVMTWVATGRMDTQAALFLTRHRPPSTSPPLMRAVIIGGRTMRPQ